MKTLQIGDGITYRGCWGRDPEKAVTIKGMDLTKIPRDTHGERVKEVTYEQVRQNLVLFLLSDGHWCYSDQVVLR